MKIKNLILNSPLVSKVIVKLLSPFHKLKFKNSSSYWRKRYAEGGNSGPGSFGQLAEYKANFLNDFFYKKNVSSVIEFGCGNGQQSQLFQFKSYIGLDVSETAIKQSIEKFKNSDKHSFFLYNADCYQDSFNIFKADAALSLDVIYHLVEDSTFEKYIKHLLNSSSQWVVIYSSDQDDIQSFAHVKHRKFTNYIETHFREWTLLEKVKNPFHTNTGELNKSHANFYIYQRVTRADK